MTISPIAANRSLRRVSLEIFTAWRARWASAGVMIAALVAGGLAARQLHALAALFAVALLASWYVLCLRRPVAAVVGIVVLLCFSEHLIAIGNMAGVPPTDLRPLLVAKDLAAWTLLLALLHRPHPRRARVASSVLLYIAVALVYLAEVSAPDVSFLTALGSMRDALVAPVALATAALLSERERHRVVRASVSVITVGAVYGIVEQLILPTSYLTNVIGVGRFWIDVKQQPLFVNPLTGLPGNFFTAGGFRRLSGAFGDPLSAGTVIASALVVAVAYRRSLARPRLLIGILGAALLLTFTRAGWIIAGASLVAVSARRAGLLATTRRLYGMGIVAAAVTTVVSPVRNYVLGVVRGSDGSTLAHLGALNATFTQHIPLVGRGWGSAGAAAANVSQLSVTTENAYVALGTQVGWVGLVLLLLCLASLGANAIWGPSAYAGWAVLVAVLLVSMVSEDLITFNTGWFPLLAAGLLGAAEPSALAATYSSAPTGRATGRDPSPQLEQ